MKKKNLIKQLKQKIQDLEFDKHTLNNDIELLTFEKNQFKKLVQTITNDLFT